MLGAVGAHSLSFLTLPTHPCYGLYNWDSQGLNYCHHMTRLSNPGFLSSSSRFPSLRLSCLDQTVNALGPYKVLFIFLQLVHMSVQRILVDFFHHHPTPAHIAMSYLLHPLRPGPGLSTFRKWII